MKKNPTTLRAMIHSALITRGMSIYGAEGEGEGEGEGTGSGTQTSTSTQGSSGQESDGEGEGEGEGSTRDTYTRAEMEKARREAASYRVRAQEAEKKAQEYERAQMNETERAKAEAEDAKKAAAEAQAEISRLRMERGIVTAASSARFNDPADAIPLINPDDIVLNDDGTPNQNSLNAAIAKLVKAKPYLVAPQGSGDGGAGGGPVTQKEVEQRAAAHAASITQRGGVRIAG